MTVKIEVVVVTCDKCKVNQLTLILELSEDVSMAYDRQMSIRIKNAGWNASANCGTVLCPDCGPDWSDDE